MVAQGCIKGAWAECKHVNPNKLKLENIISVNNVALRMEEGDSIHLI